MQQLQPGTLLRRVTEVATSARQSGALESVPTEYELLPDLGIPFIIRILPSLARKEEARRRLEKATLASGLSLNPFLPFDPRLCVGRVSPNHVCLLNKFNVIDRHALIVTSEFEDQDSPLTRADFESICFFLKGYSCLVFYNGGEKAGASQRHKHIQCVPLPMHPSTSGLPVERVFPAGGSPDQIQRVQHFAFRNSFGTLRTDSGTGRDCPPAGVLSRTYRSLRAHAGLAPTAPYNLLITTRWMWLVPRSQGHFRSLSVNSLGFAGSFLVKSAAEMEMVRRYGPTRILREVAIPDSPENTS